MKIASAVLSGFLLVSACSGPADIGADAAPELPDATPLEPRCEPEAVTQWLAEGDNVIITVRCKTGIAVSASRIQISGLPVGAQWNADALTLSWLTSLADAAVYKVVIDVSSTPIADPNVRDANAETATWTIGVADAFDNPSNVAIVDINKYPMEYGLPVVFLDHEPVADAFESVTVTYRGISYPIAAKLRGASSYYYPKQSYTLDFSGNKLTDAEAGFVGEQKVVLTTTFDDNSHLRVRLAWKLWNSLDPTVKVAAQSVIVYHGTSFEGIYTMTDHVDNDLMESYGLDKNGSIYKAVNHEANFNKFSVYDGSPKASLSAGYVKKHGEPPTDFSDLEELVGFVANSSDLAFREELPNRIALADYQAWFVFAVFARTDDSAGKNSYHHKSPTSPWHMVPWDFNASFGQQWETSRAPAAVYDYSNYNLLFGRMLRDETLGPALRMRGRDALTGPLAVPVLQAVVDEWSQQLLPSVARDNRRWQDKYVSYFGNRAGTTSAQETAYIRQWIADQSALLTQYFQ
jgi:spore coat protein H